MNPLRLPFVGLILIGVAGILLGHFTPCSSFVFFACTCVTGVGAIFKIPGAFWLFILSSFATLHIWQSRESPAALLAQHCQADWLPITATGKVTSHTLSTTNTSKQSRFTLYLDHITFRSQQIPITCPILVHWKGPPPRYGDRFELLGAIRNVGRPRNPGEFNYAKWLGYHGIYSEIHVTSKNHTRFLGNAANPLLKAAYASQEKLSTWITNDLIKDSPEAANLITALTLGLTTRTSKEIQDAFRTTGTLHLFSVSGLHVAIVAGILSFALNLIRVPKPVLFVSIIPLLFFYVAITGLKAPSLRAATMLSILFIGFLINRKSLLLNSLAATAVVFLLIDTNQLFDIGFQLSFWVVASICLLSPRIQILITNHISPDPFLPRRLLTSLQRTYYAGIQHAATLASVSLAAWLGSLPLILAYFHLVSLYAVPANLLAVPLSFVVLSIATLSIISAFFSSHLSVIFNHANLIFSKILLSYVSFFSTLPGSFFYIGLPPWNQNTPEMTVFDFSPGACNAIHFGNKTWLIDTGSEYYTSSVLIPYLHSKGISNISALFLTHRDKQHIGGASILEKTVSIQQIVEGNPINDSTLTQSAPISVEVLYAGNSERRNIADDRCLVLRFKIQNTHILLTSDSGLATEMWLLQNKRDKLRCDILITGHHQSGISTTSAFLDAAQPRVIITSAAGFPPNQRISPEWEKEITHRQIRLFRQDKTGAVKIRFLHEGFTLQAWKEEQNSYPFLRIK